MVEEATPVCFSTGVPLSFTNGTCPTRKFTMDRIVFDQEGKALRYGDKDQALVASSFFTNRTIDQRVRYLNQLDEGWEDGIQWADGAIDKLRGYNAEAEKGRPWTADWEQRWRRFFSSKLYIGKVDRVQWSKTEWRFFHETCQSRSLVTGQHLQGSDAQIDRIFNSDNYAVWNCILIERGLNFAKRSMSEFQTSNTFHGHCKLAHGVSILRAAIKEVLDKSRAHRAGATCATKYHDKHNKYKHQLVDSIDNILGLLMYQRCMFGSHDLVLKEVDPHLVEHTFGRIRIIKGRAVTVLDEPFVSKAVKNYFSAIDPYFMKEVRKRMVKSIAVEQGLCLSSS
ncbi:hypothetical protein EDD21DRAFT_420888 [Dissophora ornata]|nr:hypothetical protein EDD21DRAFT_420888 [Dissophora ornata]